MLLISVQALHSLACPAHLVSSAQRLVILRRPLKRSFAVHTTSFRHSSSPLTSHTAAQLTQAKQQDRLFTLAQHLILAAAASCPLPAAAADVNYTPGQGADVVRNVGGLAYVGLLGFWLFKVVGRRIKRSTTERLASQQDKAVDEVDVADANVSVGAAFLGAVQASFFTYLLFLFSNSISGYFSQQGLPDNYTARNMSVTFRTAIGGLAYLATFIFGANAAGLTGLTLKLLISPDDQPSSAKDSGKPSQDETQ